MGLFGRKKFVNKCYQCSKEIDVGHVGLGGKGLEPSEACPHCGAPANGEWYARWLDGRVKQKGTYKNGKLHGPLESYYADGQLWMKGTYKNGKGDGPYEHYYGKGQPWRKGTMVDGKHDGPYEEYHVGGEVIAKGNYNMGEKCGEWIETGEFETEGRFDRRTVTYPPCSSYPEGGTHDSNKGPTSSLGDWSDI